MHAYDASHHAIRQYSVSMHIVHVGGWAKQVSELCFACLVGAQRTLQHNDNVKNEPNTWLVKTLQYVLSTF